jgi:RNA polymerase sigma-70 factor (ECF subfamily)
MSGATDFARQSDEHLAIAVQAGDAASASAYALLYKRHAPAVLAFLASRMRDRTEAADLCQHVWLKVWERLETQFEAEHFRGWVFQMARNLLIDHHRRRRPHAIPEELDPSDPRGDVAADCIDERVAQLRPCVEDLPADRRAIVEQRLAGRSFDVISEQLGIPPNTAMTRFHRAKDQLKDCIEQRGTTR